MSPELLAMGVMGVLTFGGMAVMLAVPTFVWWRFRPVAKKLGLSPLKNGMAKGYYDGKEFRLLQTDLNKFVLRVQSSSIPESLTIGPEWRGSVIPDVQVGYREFDDAVRVMARDSSLVLALMTLPARELILHLLGKNLQVNERKVTCRLGFKDDAKKLAADMVLLIKSLSITEAEVPTRLESRFNEERRAGVRLSILLSLIREHSSSEEANRVAGQGLKDEDPGVRLAASVFQRAEFDPGSMGTTPTEEEVSHLRRAVHAITHPPLFGAGKFAFKALSGLLQSGPPAAKSAALEGLGRIRRKAALDATLAYAEKTRDPEALVAVAKILKARGSGRYEAFAIRLLSHKLEDVQKVAAEALAKFGTAKSVAPLQSLIGGWVNTPLERAAQTAIIQIQSRLGPAERGTLAVAEETENDEGAVSIAEEQGRLSEAWKDAEEMDSENNRGRDL